MKTFLTVLFVMVAFVLSVYKSAKKQMDGNVAPRRQRASANRTDNVESDESPFGKDDLGEPYFSYEYVSEESEPKANNKKAKKSRPVVENPRPVVAVSPAMDNVPVFDLRQAVIYQTVLNNRYIDEINQ